MTMPNDQNTNTNPPPAQPPVDYEAKFKGLQGEFQKLQGNHGTLGEAHKALTDKYTALNGQFEVLTGNHEKLTKEREELNTKLTATSGQLSRLQMIAKEFPALLPFEMDGTLPAGEGDELKGKLTKFAASLEALGKNAATAAVTGAANMTTPPANQAPPARTVKQVEGEAIVAMKNGDMVAYEKLSTEAHQLRSKATA